MSTGSEKDAAQQPHIPITDAKAIACYANFCRVTGTPEELMIDFGLNKQPMGVPTGPIEITQRIVLNFYTAKRLWAALGMSLQRHEQAFGVLETDVQKRVVPGAFRQPQTSGSSQLVTFHLGSPICHT